MNEIKIVHDLLMEFLMLNQHVVKKVVLDYLIFLMNVNK